ncbi:hypothetical protein BH10PSE17_BH10PSE17_25110 [soil metagenome]
MPSTTIAAPPGYVLCMRYWDDGSLFRESVIAFAVDSESLDVICPNAICPSGMSLWHEDIGIDGDVALLHPDRQVSDVFGSMFESLDAWVEHCADEQRKREARAARKAT